jgi:D-proline reductase (dithiol) PrdB
MQTVGLAQATVEDRGIPTASITMLADITAKISPPRALSVPYPLGFPFGEANNVELQTEILMQLLALLVRNDVPVLEGLRN